MTNGSRYERRISKENDTFGSSRQDLPEVGDLQRSSEALDPSLESHITAGATEIVIKRQTGLRCS